jgi:hypothetical protein
LPGQHRGHWGEALHSFTGYSDHWVDTLVDNANVLGVSIAMVAVSAIGAKMVAGVFVLATAFTGGHAVLNNQAVVRQASSNSSLTITYHPSSSSQVTFKVSCLAGSISGTHPNKKAICAAIAKQGTRLFAPVPTGIVCSQIYGGPETATITGTVKGRKINSTFSRTDGCQVARWNNARTLFTFPGYATVHGRIEVSPTCPGPQRPGQNCTNPSVAGKVTFTSNVQRTVKATAVADSGFSVLLRMGTWTFTGITPSAMRCSSSTLTVPTPGEVVLACDTGIR